MAILDSQFVQIWTASESLLMVPGIAAAHACPATLYSIGLLYERLSERLSKHVTCLNDKQRLGSSR